MGRESATAESLGPAPVGADLLTQPPDPAAHLHGAFDALERANPTLRLEHDRQRIVQAVLASARADGDIPTVLLWGASGSGKTHALHALEAHCQRQAGRILCASVFDPRIAGDYYRIKDYIRPGDEEARPSTPTLFLPGQVEAGELAIVVIEQFMLMQSEAFIRSLGSPAVRYLPQLRALQQRMPVLVIVEHNMPGWLDEAFRRTLVAQVRVGGPTVEQRETCLAEAFGKLEGIHALSADHIAQLARLPCMAHREFAVLAWAPEAAVLEHRHRWMAENQGLARMREHRRLRDLGQATGPLRLPVPPLTLAHMVAFMERLPVDRHQS